MRSFLAFLLSAALAGAAPAHDFWIRPTSFRPGPDRIDVDLRVGEGFRGEPVARNPERIDRFVSVAKAGEEKPVAGIDGKSPAGYLRAPAPVWIAYRSKPSSLELPAEKFEAYLREEGLERIVAERAERGESALPGRERYARCARAFVGSPAADTALARATLGLPLEIAIEDGPSEKGLGLRVLFDGRPLAGALVGLAEESHPEVEVRLRSDAEGRVRFERCGQGVWLARSVHMVRAPEGSEADWESSWASVTFEIAR